MRTMQSMRMLGVHGAIPSRLERGILTEATINIGHDPALPTKKRKRDNALDELGSWASFTINPHPSTAFDKPQTLTPILLLPRSRLPLSCLDHASLPSSSPCPRLFAAQINCLDPVELESKRLSTLSVLIARLEGDGSLAAIERVDKGIYALCKLGNWVKLDQLRAVALPTRDEAPPSYEERLSTGEGYEWWEAAKMDSSVLRKKSRSKLVRDTAGCPTVTKRVDATPNCEEISLDSGTAAELNTNIFTESFQEPHPTNVTIVAPTESTPQEILEMIQIQYLESLYISKTSLAYFAKGPLSRARASFHKDESLSSTLEDLVMFLRSSILSLNVMDKKYRDCLPNVVQSLSPGDVSDDQIDGKTSQKPRKKKRKTFGPGKNGLFTQEERYIARWWRANHDDFTATSIEETRDQLIRRRISSLRTRETKLQIILILEFLALEMAITKGEGTTADPKDEGKNSKKGKGKKKQDLDLMLELLADRLCIWQSVNNEAASGGGPGKTSGSTQVSNQDDLRDFCAEVIVPFYAARLPEKCAAVSRKLGGPSIPSPVRPSNNSKSANISKSSKRPGVVSKRSFPEASRRKFERVLTDERLAQVRGDSRRSSLVPPTLTRSATVPAIPALKRERTETPTPLSEIPAKGSRQMSVSRGGVLTSRGLHQREVDLGASMNKKSMDAKAKQNTQIENELKGAITALKKPNRNLAIRDYVESCERRTLNGGSNTKRIRKTTGDLTARTVQVEATPRGKHKAAMTGTVFPASQQEALVGDNCIPSSSLPLQMQYMHSQQDMISPVVRRTLPTVQDTPCRGASKFATRIPSSVQRKQEPMLPLSPSNIRQNSSQMISEDYGSYGHTGGVSTTVLTTSNIISETPSGRVSKKGSQKLIMETVSMEQNHKKVDVRSERMTTTITASTTTVIPEENENEISIYESLGWNDELDELA